MKVSDAMSVVLGRVIGALAIIFSLAGMALMIASGQSELLVDENILQFGILGVGFGAFGLLVIPAQPRNPAARLPALGGFFAGLYVISYAVLLQFVSAAGIEASELLDMVVADVFTLVDDGAAVLLILSNVAGTLAFFLVFIGLVYFPDGSLPSPRWRWLIWAAAADMVVLIAGLSWAFRPESELQVSADTSEFTGLGALVRPASFVALLAAAAVVSSLFIRFRGSDETTRLQLRWIMWGGGALVFSLAWDLLWGTQLMTTLGEVALVASYVIAITKYRLFDIDVIISKTFVYGTLAAFIGAVYVALVVGVGSAFGDATDPNPVLAVAATALVAVGFQPLRKRLQRVANRIVYGKRATPYEVLSEFSRQVAATDESLLEPVARFLTEGTAASGAAVWSVDDGRMKKLSAWPEAGTAPEPVTMDAAEGPKFRGADVVLPITHEDDLLGALTLTLPPGQELNRNDRALAEELSAGMGLALRNIRLTQALEDRVAELRESRRRIVAVQDETRRRLERDLHDGAQQRLVALKVKLALAGQLAAKDGAARTVDFLGDLTGQADEAVAVLREFARGVYPPLLEAEGLGAALPSAVDRLPIAVDVAAEGVGRYPKDVEATVYFCVLEALHNVVTFSGASSAQVMLADDEKGLRFEVRDAGSGFDPERVDFGSGLQNIRDRLDAAGGTFSIASSPGRGTVIGGTLPVREGAAT